MVATRAARDLWPNVQAALAALETGLTLLESLILPHTGRRSGWALTNATRGEMRRGREVHQLDIGYPESPLALESRERSGGLLAGDRPPDAPIRGAAGQTTRLFELFKGTHWTLLGYELARDRVPPRAGLHIQAIGPCGDVIDEGGHVRDAYTLTPGEWVLVRPAMFGAIVASGEIELLETYLQNVGLSLRTGDET